MKNRILTICLIVLMNVMCLSACGSEASAGENGNSTGNIANGGSVMAYEDYIFCSMEDGIYRIKEDGSQKEIIHKFNERMGGGACINIVDGWVYFYDLSTSGNSIGFYKIRTNGEELTYICDPLETGTFVVVDDYFYFSGCARVKIGDTKFEEIYSKHSASGYSVNIVDGMIYLFDSEDKEGQSSSDGIYKFDLDGENITKLMDCRTDYMIVDGDWVYFEKYKESGAFYRMKVDGSEVQPMIGEQVGHINSFEDWIFCDVEIDGVGGIYRMKKDGSEYKLLTDDKGTRTDGIYIVNEWLYYSFIADHSKRLYRMKLDGTENQLFLEIDD